MKGLFSIFKKKKKKKKKDNSAKRRDNINVLEKRSSLLDKKIENEIKKAKLYLKKGQKLRAKQCIFRKKNYEKQRARLLSQINNLEKINMSIEDAQLQKDIFKTQIEGANELKKIQKKMGGIEKIEEKLDDISETMEKQEEIGNALGQNLGEEYDEDEMEVELDGLMDETLDEEMMGVGKGNKIENNINEKEDAKSSDLSELDELSKELETV